MYNNKYLSETLLLYDICVPAIYSPYIQVHEGSGKGKEINKKKKNDRPGSLIK